MILGLDLATSTGWCMGTGATTPVLGSVRIPGEDDIGAYLDFYFRWLNAKIDVMKDLWVGIAAKEKKAFSLAAPLVCFEAPMLPTAKFDRDLQRVVKAPVTLATTRKLQGLAGLTEMICRQKGVECREEFLQSIKKGLTGSGKADKLDMMRACKRAGLEPSNSDEADGFGVWLVAGVRNYAKPFAADWDRKIYSPNPR